jgi:ketosteroid isomerase-like protein
MSRKDVDLVWLMYEAFNRRDLGAVLALMHDSIEIEPRFGALEGDYRGHRGGAPVVAQPPRFPP